MTDEERDQDCGSNLDRAREIAGECFNALLGLGACYCSPCVRLRKIASALDELSQRHEEALRAAEERGCAIGFEAAHKALRGPREGCMCAEKNSIALLKLDPAAVCAARRAGTP